MKKSTQRGFIYFRYVFPIAASLAMLLLLLFPVYSYVTADGIKSAVSAGELISNSWQTVRQYLFDGGSDKLRANTDFSATVLALIIGLAVLYVIGFASTVWTAVTAFRFFSHGETEDKSRILFSAVVPNRVVACIYQALTLPLFAFPCILPLLYKSILNYTVKLSAMPFDMLWIAVMLWGVCVLFSVLSARMERGGLNVFARKKATSLDAEAPRRAEAQVPEDAYSEMDGRAREEQAERIRRLLNGDMSDADATENSDMKEDNK